MEKASKRHSLNKNYFSMVSAPPCALLLVPSFHFLLQ